MPVVPMPEFLGDKNGLPIQLVMEGERAFLQCQCGCTRVNQYMATQLVDDPEHPYRTKRVKIMKMLCQNCRNDITWEEFQKMAGDFSKPATTPENFSGGVTY